MYLIYYISAGTIRPVVVISTIKLTDRWISENQIKYENELTYMKLNYIWE